ncbi:MAG: hypothetical protein ACYTAN_12955 [Planctomycetota bacterium]|jgi:hypothetical protein
MDNMQRVILVIACIHGLALATSCADRHGTAPTSQVNAREQAARSGYVQRLVENGFVKTEDTDTVLIYEKGDMKIEDLVRLLGLNSSDDFEYVPNAPPIKWLLRARLPGDAWCVIEAPRAFIGGPDSPPESTRFAASVRFYPSKVISMVIVRGMPWEEAYAALQTVGAQHLSRSSWRVEGPGENGGNYRSMNTYVLPDGTLAQFTLRPKFKQYEVLKMTIGPKGKRYSDDRQRIEDEQNGLIRETDKIDLREYMLDPTK